MSKTSKRLFVLLVIVFTYYSGHQVHADQATTADLPKVVVAVEVTSPGFRFTGAAFRVVYGKAKQDYITLEGYDFKAAFAEELMSVLSEDKRMGWRLATEADGINVQTLLKENSKSTQLPSVKADRLLLVQVVEYGAYTNFLQRRCYVACSMKLIDLTSGKTSWSRSESIYDVHHQPPTVDLPKGKNIGDLQAENQQGLKEVLNRAIEHFCQKLGEDLRKKKL